MLNHRDSGSINLQGHCKSGLRFGSTERRVADRQTQGRAVEEIPDRPDRSRSAHLQARPVTELSSKPPRNHGISERASNLTASR